ncbi:MAG: threonine synthase [Pseudomonadota bacterium]|nr:threonine synthase [Pseudomonadota bacterium]
MKFVSTRDNKKSISFKKVSLEGLAQDGGLYIPHNWKMLDLSYDKKNVSFQNIAFQVIKNFVGNEINFPHLESLITDSYKNFSNKEITPLKKVENNHWILELFHGPTLAFKDIALQFLGNLFNYFLDKKEKKLNIIGATSGDTGSAAIEAVKNNKNVNIFILHPYNRVSEFQRRQMTTVNSKNVYNIAVKGTFDDCQYIVKKLFKDKASKEKRFASINSINWSRIMAQISYYIYAYEKLSLINDKKKISFSVPTGNFGDAYAGYLAKSKFNIPIHKLIIATNENDILNRFFRKGEYKKNFVRSTYSPSMDIQVASNFERLLYDILKQDSTELTTLMKEFEAKDKLYLNDKYDKKILNTFLSYKVSNKQTIKAIKSVYDKYKIILDPHTAVGFFASLEYLKENKNDISVTLATAHPAKFSDSVTHAININPKLPLRYKNIYKLNEKFKVIDNDYSKIKKYIFNNSVI